jgi:small subunit ribosomal protein S17
MVESALRNTRKSITGIVSSRSGDKTVKVSYAFKAPHPVYIKEISRKTVVVAHDANNECGVGDKVVIEETRPLSKIKRWRVVTVISKAPIVGA